MEITFAKWIIGIGIFATIVFIVGHGVFIYMSIKLKKEKRKLAESLKNYAYLLRIYRDFLILQKKTIPEKEKELRNKVF